MGRPSLYTPEVAALICERLEGGESLRASCEAIGVNHATALNWVRDDVGGFANQYARSCEIGRALRFERLIERAASKPERDDKGRIDPGWVQWMRMQIDTEKWTLAKQEPKKYGDRQHVEHSGELTLEQLVRASYEQKE